MGKFKGLTKEDALQKVEKANEEKLGGTSNWEIERIEGTDRYVVTHNDDY